MSSRRRPAPATLVAVLALLAATCAPAVQPAARDPARAAPTNPPATEAARPSGPPTASAEAPPTAAPVERVAVRMGVLGVTSDAAFYIAMERGYFAEQGLDTQAEPFRSAADMIAPLGAGQLDVGGGNPSPGLFNAVQRDIAIRIVADKGQQTPGRGSDGMVVRKELVDNGTFRDLADLKGMTVAGSNPGAASEIVLDTALRPVGLSTRDLHLVTMNFPDMPAALGGGAIDAAMAIEPFITIGVERNLGVLWKRGSEILPHFQSGVVVFGPQLLSKPDPARRFLVAYLKAARFYNEASNSKGTPAWSELVDILVQHTNVKDRPIYERMGLPGLDPDVLVNLDALRLMQDWWVERGLQTEKVDLDRAVDDSFARAAAAELGPARR